MKFKARESAGPYQGILVLIVYSTIKPLSHVKSSAVQGRKRYMENPKAMDEYQIKH